MTENSELKQAKKIMWIPKSHLASSIVFMCPHCFKTVYYYHGSASKSRKQSQTMKRCPYEFCPWCGEKLTPYRVNYISD